MEIRFRLDDTTDIKWLKSFPKEERANIIRHCISIGRSILTVKPKLIYSPTEFMEPFKNDINNHLENVKTVMDTSSRLVFEPILGRFDKLCCQIDVLTGVTSKSALKGKMGEELISRSLKAVFPEIDIKDMSKKDHECDFHLTLGSTKILLEVKTYTNSVPSSQIEKLYQDINFTGFKFAIMASTTSNIVKRKEFDWEIYQDSIIVYISNTGLTGIGIVCAIQFILAINELKGTKNETPIRLDNFELDHFANELGDHIDNLLQHLTRYSKLRYNIGKFETTVSNGLRDMYTEIIDIESDLRIHLHSLAQCYHRKLLPLTTIDGKINIQPSPREQLMEFIEKQKPNKNEYYLRILTLVDKIGPTIIITINNGEWDIISKKKLIAKTESNIHKVYIVFDIKTGENYQFTGFEKNRNKQLLIQICQETYSVIEKMFSNRIT
jgi:hypothetical protein